MTLLNFVRIVFGKVSLFAILETYFVVVTPLAFFLRKTILALSLGVLALVFLHLAYYNSVAILIFTMTLLPYVC